MLPSQDQNPRAGRARGDALAMAAANVRPEPGVRRSERGLRRVETRVGSVQKCPRYTTLGAWRHGRKGGNPGLRWGRRGRRADEGKLRMPPCRME